MKSVMVLVVGAVVGALVGVGCDVLMLGKTGVEALLDGSSSILWGAVVGVLIAIIMSEVR